ncbi:MAG: hypothetical protein ACRELW_20410 [Candidatus Rokuibacteriota bacterium]
MLTRREFLAAGTAAAAFTATPSGALAQTPGRPDAVPPTSPSPVNARPSDNLGGSTINVGGNPGDLQTAVNKSQQGDTLVCPAGAVYGPVLLPVRTGPGWTCIRSSVSFSSGTRVTPSDASRMFKVLGSGAVNASRAISMPGGDVVGLHSTQGWRFIGMEATHPNDNFSYAVIEAGADRMSFESCYIHGRPTQGMRRCFYTRGNDFQIWDSWVSDAHEVGADSQAIFFRNCARFHVENCELQGAAENILLGDQGSASACLDGTIRRNHFFKPLTWLSRLNDNAPNPQYSRQNWSVKNLFEIKWAFRVLFEGNLLENSCGGNQDGTAFLINAGQPGGVQDVLAVSNIIRNAPHMFTINTFDTVNSIPVRIALRNNLGREITGRFLMLLHRNSDVALEHNTCVPMNLAALRPGVSIQAIQYSPARAGYFSNHTLKRNIFGSNRYGMFVDGGQSLDVGAPDRVFAENAEYDLNGRTYPGVRRYSSLAAAGINADGTLKSDSPLKVGQAGYFGTDGKDIGVDFVALAAAQETGLLGKAPRGAGR